MMAKNRPVYGPAELLALVRPRPAAVEAFESAFAAFVGGRFAVAFGYGRSCLFALLEALGISGREVAIPAYTCMVVANAVVHSGNRPLFVDVGLPDLNMDVEDLPRRMSGETAAVVPTHLYGHPMDVAGLKARLAGTGVLVIEDCALSLAPSAGGRPAFAGDVALYSLGVGKHISTVEGGVLVTNSEGLYRKLRDYRDRRFRKPGLGAVAGKLWRVLAMELVFSPSVYGVVQGLTRRSDRLRRTRNSFDLEMIEMPGDFDVALTELQARLGLVQLAKAPAILERRARIVRSYHELLRDLPGLALPPLAADPSYSHYTVRVIGMDRDRFRDRMARGGVEVGRTFDYALPSLPVFSASAPSPDYPVATRAAREVVNLPNYPHLGDAQVARIAGCVRDSLGG